MPFEWDEAKNQTNIEKHGISFEQAITIFDGDYITIASPRQGEERKLSLGIYDGLVIVAVVHLERTGATRIISARPAKRKERAIYEKAIYKATYH